MNRGIIAAPGVIDITMTGVLFRPALTPEDIRFYLMYWDKIIIPTNNLMHFSIPDEQDLINSNAIWRPRTQLQGAFQGNEIGKAIIAGQCEIAQLVMKDKSTDWVLHQVGENFYMPDEFSASNNVLKVDITGALPIPPSNVNINEILEFKERRSDELGSLHQSLDELYIEILSCPDQDLAARKAISRLKKSIDELDKVSQEKFNVIRKFDLSAELNLNGKDIAVGAASGAAIDFFTTGYTLPIATTIGAIASFIQVKGKSTKTFKHAQENEKLSYLSHASKEEIIKRD